MNDNYATVWEAISDVLPDRPAIIHGEVIRTWREFDNRAARLATALRELGVGPGSLLAIDMWNCPENLEVTFAAFKLRAIPFNANYRYLEHELTYLLNDSKASVIVFDPTLRDRLTAAVERANQPVHLIHAGEVSGTAGALSTEGLIAESAPAPRIPRDGDDELVIYTGGTTGMPKGVVWSHFATMNQGSMGENTPPLDEHLQVIASSDQKFPLVISPLMHGIGIFGAIAALTQGGGLIFCESRSLNPEEICTLIQTRGVTSFNVVGDAIAKPILDELTRAASEGNPYDLSSLQVVGNSGVVWSSTVKTGYMKYGSFVIRDGIASTEGGGFGSIESSAGDQLETGRFKLGPNAKVVDENLVDVVAGSGAIGYLAATGNLPKGYLNDPEKTAKTWPTIDGKRYCVPGDMATLDIDGMVTLMGRGSEVVNTGGEKVFVEEVEQAIATHPSVRDALVVGLPDERWGSRVTALVALEGDQKLSERDVIEHVGTQLADYKRPRQVVFVNDVPRGPTGKADRTTAKQVALQSLSLRVR